MNKIVVIGSGGAGKSTLSKQLGQLLDVPIFHLDALYWKPGWVLTPEEERDKLMEELVAGEQWIIDGNYGRTMDIRLREADTVIYLDYPTSLCLFRAIKRRIKYHRKTRSDMGEGCEERISYPFIQWIAHYRRDHRPGILQKLNHFMDRKQIYIFTSPKQVNLFLKRLEEKST